ncbi:hypothetical protein BGX31_010112 [Mortierella sp. GBA43]|nr:hypothetical protein BGX31_010112 [Mortierella sp. GBA43]
MNNLVNYGSDIESDSEESVTAIAPKQPLGSLQSTTSPNKILKTDQLNLHESANKTKDQDGDTLMMDPVEGGDDDIVSAALKDLQSFAESVEPDMEISSTTTTPVLDPTVTNGRSLDATIVDKPMLSLTTVTELTEASRSIELSSDQQLAFDAFLQEIDNIPMTTEDQSHPPGSHSTTNEAHTRDCPADLPFDELEWQKAQPVQSIYSRMHQLSLLNSPTIDQKDIENRLIEFAIRILDWERGGMRPEYFMGEARSQAMVERKAAGKVFEGSDQVERDRNDQGGSDNDDHDNDMNQDDSQLPSYAGIVGDMLKHMYTVEQLAAPSGWRVVWNPKDSSYGFRHLASPRKSCQQYRAEE